MAVGAWTWFDIATEKFVKGDINWDQVDFNIALTAVTQPLDGTFAGASGNCQYSDLTSELATGSGYTSGGQALGGFSVIRTGGLNVWGTTNPSWSLSADITFKYAVIYQSALPNKDLLCFVDCDTSGGSVTTVDSYLEFVLSAGILRAARV